MKIDLTTWHIVVSFLGACGWICFFGMWMSKLSLKEKTKRLAKLITDEKEKTTQLAKKVIAETRELRSLNRCFDESISN